MNVDKKTPVKLHSQVDYCALFAHFPKRKKVDIQKLSGHFVFPTSGLSFSPTSVLNLLQHPGYKHPGYKHPWMFVATVYFVATGYLGHIDKIANSG